MPGVRLIHEIGTSATVHPLRTGSSPVSALMENPGDRRSSCFRTSRRMIFELLVRSRNRIRKRSAASR